MEWQDVKHWRLILSVVLQLFSWPVFVFVAFFFFTVRLHLRHFSIISSQNASGYFTVCICVCFSLLMSEERNNWIPRSYFSFIETHTCACECVCVHLTLLLCYWPSEMCVCVLFVFRLSVCLPVCPSACFTYYLCVSLSVVCIFPSAHCATFTELQQHSYKDTS